MQIEICVLVADLLDGDEDVDATTLPAGEWLIYLDRGPTRTPANPTCKAAHATVREWAQDHGLAFAQQDSDDDETKLAGCIEQYRIGPHEESDYTRWETELAYLMDSAAIQRSAKGSCSHFLRCGGDDSSR